MSAKKIFLLVLLILFSTISILWAQIGFNQQKMQRKNEPIEIISDKMEAFQEKRVVIFSGNAVATQGDVRLQADRLSIYYKEAADKKDQKTNQQIEATGDLEKIELKGNVIITQKDMSATGAEAVYYQDTAQFVMTGNPVLRQDKTTIKGCRVVIYMDESRGKVEQCVEDNSGRVTAVIHPQKNNTETKQPATDKK